MSIQSQPPLLSALASSDADRKAVLAQGILTAHAELVTALEALQGFGIDEKAGTLARVARSGQALAKLAEGLLGEVQGPDKTRLRPFAARLGAVWARFAPQGAEPLVLRLSPDLGAEARVDPAVLARVAFWMASAAGTQPARLNLAPLAKTAGLSMQLDVAAALPPPAPLALFAACVGAHLGRDGKALLRIDLPAIAVPQPAAFDPAVLPRLIDLAGPATASELLTRFHTDLTQAEVDLAIGITEPEPARLRGATHVLISLAGAAGAMGLCQLARDLNAAAQDDDPVACRRLAGPVLIELARLFAVLQDLATASPGTP